MDKDSPVGTLVVREDLVGIEDQVFPDRDAGKFKVEIHVTDDGLGVSGMLGGNLKVWLSSSTTSGNCDESVYFCRWCHHPLLPNDHGIFDRDNDRRPVKPYRGALCPPKDSRGDGGCGRLNRGEEMIDFRHIFRSIEDWLDTLEYYHHLLKGDVDYYLKRYRGRMVKAVVDRLDSTSRSSMAAAIDYARKNYVDKEVVLYSLPRLIVDTQTGAELRTALRAFLTA